MNQFTGYIQAFANIIHTRIEELKLKILDILISEKQNQFNESLRRNDYKNALLLLEPLQKYLFERHNSSIMIEKLSDQFYSEQFNYVLYLIEKSFIEVAESNLALFTQLNKSRSDIKAKSDELYYKLINKRGEKNYQDKKYLESYSEFLILLKLFPEDRYLTEFLKAFSAYAEVQLQYSFVRNDTRTISAIYDSLTYYESRFPDYKPLAELNRQMRKKLPGFMNEILRVDFEATNYYFIPGGEHYLGSEYNQSVMYSFLLLKIPFDQFLEKLLNIWAIEEGLTMDKLLARQKLKKITPLEREYTLAGGWMTLKEANTYKRLFFKIPEFKQTPDYLTIKVDEIGDESLEKRFLERSEVDRRKINEQIPPIRQQNGFVAEPNVKFDQIGNIFSGGYSIIGNTQRYFEDPSFNNITHFGYWIPFGAGICFSFSSKLSPIPDDGLRPAQTYFTISLVPKLMWGNQREYQIFLGSFNLGVGLIFRQEEKTKSFNWFQKINFGVSFNYATAKYFGNRLDLEKELSSSLYLNPFISYSYGCFEVFYSHDLVSGMSNQIGIGLILSGPLIQSW